MEDTDIETYDNSHKYTSSTTPQNPGVNHEITKKTGGARTYMRETLRVTKCSVK